MTIPKHFFVRSTRSLDGMTSTPPRLITHRWRGRLRLAEDDDAGAEVELSAAIQLNADLHFLWGDRGVARYAQGLFSEALSDFETKLLPPTTYSRSFWSRTAVLRTAS